MILHTHFLLHLYLISTVLDYLSLINTKYRFERDKVSKTKKKAEEETVWQRLRKKLRIPRLDYQDRELLWIVCITATTQTKNGSQLSDGLDTVRYENPNKVPSIGASDTDYPKQLTFLVV